MPNRKHPSRGKAPKKPLPVVATDVDIIFTNSIDDKKPTKQDVTGVKGKATENGADKASSRAGDEGSPGPSDTASKKPDARTLIGGASWTGKLPVNLLSEHCQKQKWERPEYTMVDYLAG